MAPLRGRCCCCYCVMAGSQTLRASIKTETARGGARGGHLVTKEGREKAMKGGQERAVKVGQESAIKSFRARGHYKGQTTDKEVEGNSKGC